MQKLTLATLGALAFTLVSTNVFAVDGTITVNGAVTDQTCTLQPWSSIGGITSGLKNLTLTLPTLSKSSFTPSSLRSMLYIFSLKLTNATGTDHCDVATTQAFKGIHFSVTSPATNLDATDKTLLVNQATDASITNPVFIQFLAGAGEGSLPVDFSALWGAQAKAQLDTIGIISHVYYAVRYVSKTGIVDAQTVQATVNYTLHYN
ncbi:putative thin pilus major protein AcuA [Acinetobacter guillouiae]|uniref:fimbrial protein n=1 Tax=Acinetobacter guillouiae TaxID=106649 RepID=UPI0004EF602C|nr:type 1 fimbrial protein [Acinetobacter guillouiae]BAP37915.1 putative thin pilus major protein AcuA [Acinetobacter guillouiae]